MDQTFRLIESFQNKKKKKKLSPPQVLHRLEDQPKTAQTFLQPYSLELPKLEQLFLLGERFFFFFLLNTLLLCHNKILTLKDSQTDFGIFQEGLELVHLKLFVVFRHALESKHDL